MITIERNATIMLSKTPIYIIMSAFCILSGCQKADIIDSNSPQNPSSSTPAGNENITLGAPTPPATDTITITGEYPKPCTVWNGHVIFHTEDDNESYNGTIAYALAQQEFTNVYSIYNIVHAHEADSLTSRYTEDGITGWEIPNYNIASIITKNYSASSNDFATLNSLLDAPLTTTSQTRYLCENAEKSFSFTSSTISKAGAQRTYQLRPVKRLYFTHATTEDTPQTDEKDPTQTDKEDTPSTQDPTITITPTIGSPKCYIYNGHAVFKTDSTSLPDYIIMTCISLEEGESKASEAYTFVQSYTEGELCDWQLPTEEEAGYLRDNYGLDAGIFDDSALYGDPDYGDLHQLNDLFFTKIEARLNNTNAKYLCANGDKVFSFVKNTKITEAGKSTSYIIRLVKTIKIPKH